MLRNSSKMFLGLMVLAAIVAWSGSASADIVASFTGPQTFTGTLGAGDSVVLDPVSTIGTEGTISFDFTIPTTSTITANETLWYCTDTFAGQTAELSIGYVRSQNAIGVSV